jgi:hypothetical protein
MMIPTLSRREFLKLSSAALLGCFLADLNPAAAHAASPILGRVLATSLVVRDAPAFSGRKIRSVQRDMLIDLAEEVFGGVESDYNRRWYRLTDGAYVYAGWVQLLQPRLNPTVAEIPSGGVLGEITQPYTAAAYGINLSPSAGPRLYYASTHWITNLVTDQRDGSPWYKAMDAALNSHYYISAEAVRLIPPLELAPLSSQIPPADKHIEIFLGRQILLAYEGDRAVLASRIATGRTGFESPIGAFTTFHKRPTYHMFGGADEFSIFDLPGVPWDTYITDTGVAIHGTYWHNDFGKPHSHGCINMPPEAAKWIFRWTTPTLPPGENLALMPGTGTRVQIHPD